MIKAVLQAIPVYAMQCYKLPRGLCDKLSKEVICFWWSTGNSEKPIHWANKETLWKDKNCGGMGFRNLELFNEALLMKQAWRIASQPDLLLSRTLKSKYFPECSLLNATAGSKSSQAWKGISKTIPALFRGCSTPETSSNPTWKFSSSGQFTVSSAYKLLRDNEPSVFSRRGEQSDPSPARAFWTKLWRLHVAGRVKHLVWSIFHDSLPTRANLRRRGFLNDAHCELCGFREESSSHLFRNCWVAKVVWNCLGIGSSVLEGEGLRADDWIWLNFRLLNGVKIKWFCYALWFLWLNRNSAIFKGSSWVGEDICRRVKEGTRSFDKAGGNPKQSVLSSEPDFFRIFCDGAWGSVDGLAGVGCAVIKDGIVVSAYASRIHGVSSSLEAEGVALLRGMHLAIAGDHKKVTFFSDSVEAVEAINSGKLPSDFHAKWSNECRDLLVSHHWWEVAHIPREGNAQADLLAKKAMTEGWSWDDPTAIPCCLPRVPDNFLP